MQLELNQYLSMFIDESTEHLQAINEQLLLLEQSPKDISIVQTIFRSAHTLKGMSATMGYEDIASLTHQMENVLDMVRNNQLEMNPFIFDCLFQSTDSLEAMVQDIIAGGSGKADVAKIVASLKSIVSGEYQSQSEAAASSEKPSAGGRATDVDEYQLSVLEQSINSGYRVFFIEVTIRPDCVLKAARAYMVFNLLEQNGEIVKSTPSVEDIEQDNFDYAFSVYFISGIDAEPLQQLITSVSEIEDAKIVPLDAETLKQLTSLKKDRTSSPAARETAAAAAVMEVEKAPAAAKAAPPANGGGPVGGRTIRVDLERLDTLMNLFSELLIDRVRLEQLADEIKRSDLIETVEHMARVSSDLQNIVLKLRMVPVDTVFNRFPRMVRDIAKNLNKKVDLVITGAETELDRTVIDEIGDPLVHLLRNALDHGLESVEDRKNAGKDETGTIRLRAFHSGNHVFIEIEDDGNGINRTKVRNIAISKGIITQEQAGKMTEEQVDQLLFASGFSTADAITDLSGRGVGLDVVKSKITSLGGHVEVASNPGKGSVFSVQLPLTLSIISAMLVRTGPEKYAIPLSSIIETASVKPEQIRNVHGNRLMEYRNGIVPVLFMHEVFEVPGGSENKGGEINIVIIRKGEKMAAIVVDDFIAQQEIVLKPLGKYLTNIFAISGATILGDGQVALIIDPNALIK